MIELVPPEPADVASPCVGVCVIGDDDLCEGCARTIGEIAEWASASFADRRAILAALPGRRAGGSAPPESDQSTGSSSPAKDGPQLERSR